MRLAAVIAALVAAAGILVALRWLPGRTATGASATVGEPELAVAS